MEEKIKQRLIGVLVIIGALFIILPFLFHNSRPSLAQTAAGNAHANNSAVSIVLPSEAQSVSQANTANNAPNSSNLANATSPTSAVSSAPVQNNANSNTTGVAMPVSNNTSNPASAAPVSTNNTVNTNAVNASVASPAPVTNVAPSANNIDPRNVTANNTGVKNNANVKTVMAANTVNTASVPNSDPAPAVQSPKPSSAAEAITSATSGSLISSSGLTRGEGDDQPDAMQKQKAEAMPMAPMPNSATLAGQPVATQPVAKPIVDQVKKPIQERESERVSEKRPSHPIANRVERQPVGAYSIQVGAFDNVANAERLVAHLRQHHFEAYSRVESHNQRRLAVVYVGSIYNLHQAELDRARIDQEFHINGEIRKPL